MYKAAMKFMYRSLGECIFVFLLSKPLRVKLLGHIVQC